MPGSYKQKTIRFAYERLLLTFNVQGLCQKASIRKQNESFLLIGIPGNNDWNSIFNSCRYLHIFEADCTSNHPSLLG